MRVTDGARESRTHVPACRRHSKGHTLLEITLALGVLLLLSAGIFAVSGAAVQLTAEMAEMQNREASRDRFFGLCRQHIEGLPPEGRLAFSFVEAGSAYHAYLSFDEAPFAFALGGLPVEPGRVVLGAELAPDGTATIRVHYLDEEQEELFLAGRFERLGGQSVVLLRGVSVYRWRFYDGRSGRWVETWDEGSAERPTVAELRLALDGEKEATRLLFSVAPGKPGSVVPIDIGIPQNGSANGGEGAPSPTGRDGTPSPQDGASGLRSSSPNRTP